MEFDLTAAKTVYGLPETWPIETEVGTLHAKPLGGRGEIDKWLEECKDRGKAISITHGITIEDATDAAQIVTRIAKPAFTEAQAVEIVKTMPALVPVIMRGFTEMIEASFSLPKKAAIDAIDEQKN